MATEFQHAIDALFTDPNLAGDGDEIVTGEYHPAGGAPIADVAVIKFKPTVQGDLLRPGLVLSVEQQAAAWVADVRRSQVPQARRGDAIVIGGQTYTVVAQPELDGEKHVWRLPLREV